MTVYQKNDRWYYRFKIDGVSYHKAAKGAINRREAEKVEAIVKSEIYQGKYNLVDNKGNKLFEELEKAYTQYAMTNKRSWKNERWLVEKLLASFKGYKLKDIIPTLIEKHRADRQKEGKKDGTPLKNATLNREMEILRKMFNIAIDNGWIDQNPASSKKIPMLRENNYKDRYLEVEEEKRLFNACTGQFAYLRPVITMALNTGMRKMEMLSLKWSCIDLELGYIMLLETKSGKKRNIPISSALRRELEILDKTTEWVFPSPKGGHYNNVRSFEKLCKLVGIKNLVFHDLRHTSATRMMACNVPIGVIKDILGHADITTTMRYSHPVPQQKKEAVEILAGYGNIESTLIIQPEK